MLKKVVLAFALAAAGFASQSASASPLTETAVIADARGVSLQHIQYYDPPPRYGRRYAGPPRRYYGFCCSFEASPTPAMKRGC
jgi:hypothetical protein